MITRCKQACRNVCLLFLLLALSMLRLSAAELQFDVFVGFDNYAVQNKWMPITFEVHNPAESFNGVIVISAGGVTGVKTHMPVELPTGTRKRLQAPVFLSGGYTSWDVRLFDTDGKLRKEVKDVRPRQFLLKDAHLVGSLGRLQQGLPAFPAVQPNMSASQPVGAFLQPALFPDNPLVLQALNSLYLSSEVAVNLTPPQVNAIVSWMFQGGHLIVGVDEILETQSTPWLRTLLPMEFTGTKTIATGPELLDWIRSGYPNAVLTGGGAIAGKMFSVATGTVRDGKVILESGGTPLIITALRGRGQITVLPFSAEREPFLSWQNKTWFWAKITEIPPKIFTATEQMMRTGWTLDSFFAALIETKQVQRLPFTSLILMLVAYLAVIGPLDRYWLGRKKLEIWTWVTFPIYVVVFSGLFYVVAFMLRAGDSEYNELHVIDVHPGGTQALWAGRTYGLVYSPANRNYQFEGQGRFSTLRGERSGPWGGDRKGIDTIVLGNGSKAEVRVPIWTSKLVVSEWHDNRPALLSARFTASELIITSQVDKLITNAMFAVSNRVYFIGEIPGQGTKSFSLQDVKWEPLNSWVKKQGGNYLDMVRQRSSTWRGQSKSWADPSTAAMAGSFIRYVNRNENEWDYEKFDDEDLVPMIEAGYGVLLAWVDNHSFVKPLGDFSSKKSSRNTLLRMALLPSK